MKRSTKAFTYSSILTVGAIVVLGAAMSQQRPIKIDCSKSQSPQICQFDYQSQKDWTDRWRLVLIAAVGIIAGGAASVAHDGIYPAYSEQRDRAAREACEEAEHINALEEIQQSDDMLRDLAYRERLANIEAEAMRRSLPARLEMQQMATMLMPPQVVINGQPPLIGEQQQPQSIGSPPGQHRYFNWADLANADEHPLLMIVAKQGSGKTRLVKFLAAHVLSGAAVTAVDIFARSADWEGCKVYDNYTEILAWMKHAIGTIDSRVAEYKAGKTEFKPQLWAFEEFPDTTKSIKAIDKNNGRTIVQFMDKCSTVARKIRCRLCLISQKLNADGSGADAEVRDDATVIFPGKNGVGKAMADSRVFKLGSRRNEALRQQLSAALVDIPYPALIYSSGQWYPAIMPKLDEQGNPIVDLESLYNKSAAS